MFAAATAVPSHIDSESIRHKFVDGNPALARKRQGSGPLSRAYMGVSKASDVAGDLNRYRARRMDGER